MVQWRASFALAGLLSASLASAQITQEELDEHNRNADCDVSINHLSVGGSFRYPPGSGDPRSAGRWERIAVF